MIKLLEIRPLHLVHSLATLILVGTIALFGYELSKPEIPRVEASIPAYKTSALASLGTNPAITHRMPALTGMRKKNDCPESKRQTLHGDALSARIKASRNQ